MQVYQTKSKPISGTKYAEVYKKAHAEYCEIKKQTKRRPYIRSAFFKKDKIFLELFWQHLREKKEF